MYFFKTFNQDLNVNHYSMTNLEIKAFTLGLAVDKYSIEILLQVPGR